MSVPPSQKPPYPPTIWALGGANEKHVDVPVQSVFLVLFMIGAAAHMTIFQVNNRRAHKFLANAAIFGFCMSRIVTMTLRIASVCLPHNIRLAIAAQIFVSAGVLILFIVNLIFAQRIVRATHPSVGWHPAFSIAFKIIYVLILCTLAIVITSVIQNFYTLNRHVKQIDRDLQIYGTTFLAVVATLPLPMTIVACLVPHAPHDRFGTGRFRTKVIGLLVSTTLLAFGAWYRAAGVYKTPIPRTKPLPGYFGKAPFYIVNFTVEIITVYMYAALRIDKRWHVPNGAKGPGSYSKQTSLEPVEATITRSHSQGNYDVEANSGQKDENRSSALYDAEKAVSPGEGSVSHST